MGRTKTVTMTKKQIIEAIEVETNLEPGAFITQPEFEDPNESNCRVCAVGAVLWGAGVIPEKIYTVSSDLCTNREGLYYDTCRPIKTSSKKKREVKKSPLAALSCVFESAYSSAIYSDEFNHNDSVEEAREASIQFVKDYFPFRIKFSYNGEAVWIEK